MRLCQKASPHRPIAESPTPMSAWIRRDRLADAGMNDDIDAITLGQVNESVGGSATGASGGTSDEQFISLGQETPPRRDGPT